MKDKKDNKWLCSDIITDEKPVDESKYTLSEMTALEWLSKAGDLCLEMLEKQGFDIQSHVGKGIEFTISNTRGLKTVRNGNLGNAVGICFPTVHSDGNQRRIEIDRENSDTWQTLDTVAHEITHAILDEKIEKPHGREFSSIVKKVFKLGGTPKNTQPTYSMVKLFEQFVATNGLYPHVAYKPTRRKQTTRNIKVACLNLKCGGATKSSLKQERGAIFRISSASIEKSQDLGYKITCPVCQSNCEVGELVYENYQGTV